MIEFKIHHVCIQTNIYEESLQFYTECLGFKILKVNEFFSGRRFNTWLVSPSIMIELQTPKLGSQLNEWTEDVSGPVHIAFMVMDIESAYEYIKSKGYNRFKIKNGEVLYSVNETSRLFKVFAPEGTEIEIRNVYLP